MINPLAKIPWSLRWILCYVEWTLMSQGILLLALNGDLSRSSSLLLKFITFATAFVLLSLILPLERPRWQRRVYVLVEMLLAISAGLIGELGFNSLIPFFLFKACLLLNRKEVLLTALATVTIYIVGFVCTLPRFIAEVNAHDAIPLPNSWQIVSGTLVSLTGACAFCVLLGLMFVAERKSRQRAEALAQEVEALAAALERARIARDIHDSLGHALTTLDVQLELAQRLHQQQPALSLKSLNTAKQLASQCLQDVRWALQTIRQPNFNLNEAIISLVEQVKQNQSFKVELELDLPQLPLQISHQLYYIVREGLTNIQKHAHASWVILRGQSTPDGVVLEIADNGKGFDPGLPHTGFGLRGVRERVQGLGGEILIDSAPGQGTRILVVLPQ